MNEVELLEFAIANLNRVRKGGNGTARVDPETGYPIMCVSCGAFLYHDHKCENLKPRGKMNDILKDLQNPPFGERSEEELDALHGRAAVEIQQLREEKTSVNKWQCDDSTVYRLVESGFLRGVMVLQNEFTIHVQRGAGTTDEQAAELARRIKIVLNATEENA
jgi:hypothetical protein